MELRHSLVLYPIEVLLKKLGYAYIVLLLFPKVKEWTEENGFSW